MPTVFVIALMLAGCARLGIVGPGHELAAQLEPGNTTVQVSAVLGSPELRHLDGTREAWLYCFRGASVDDYLVAWFDNARLVDVDVQDDYIWGFCARQFDAFSWDQAPAS